MQPELIADYQCAIGENPLWHPLEKRVYWTDVPNGRLFRYDPATGMHEQCYSGEVVGGFTVQADGALLLFMARGAIAKWRDGKLDYIVSEIAGEEEFRFNDVRADPMGRVFCGVMYDGADRPRKLGRLYLLETDGSYKVLLDGIGVSNGIGFTRDLKQMYYTDSVTRKIYFFDYDQAHGAISNRRDFVAIPEGAGFPDGMTVDTEGYIWSARWDGGALVRYTPDGMEQQRITFPAKKVSSVIFGGDDLTEMYVTTAGGQNKAEEGAGAGALFRVKVDVRGVPEFFSRVKL